MVYWLRFFSYILNARPQGNFLIPQYFTIVVLLCYCALNFFSKIVCMSELKLSLGTLNHDYHQGWQGSSSSVSMYLSVGDTNLKSNLPAPLCGLFETWDFFRFSSFCVIPPRRELCNAASSLCLKWPTQLNLCFYS